FKGNYLLTAKHGGKNRKYIIRKGTPEHDEMTKIGLANLSEEKVREFLESFFLEKCKNLPIFANKI
ncbi:MAG: hypothetical protein II662_03720, partial [Bacteroidales bacterium]|nr:hypothetical protein [Bacteroidales bacterium]